MRTLSDAKRQAIMDSAAEAFAELGFERTSMSEICKRVGGSKTTLYNYFPSKEVLFFEVMFQATEGKFEAIHASLDPECRNVEDVLLEFGQRFLAFIYSPEVLPVRRLAIAESGRSDLGRLCFEKGQSRNQALLTNYLRVSIDQGKLRQTDANMAALHLSGLLLAEHNDLTMLCVQDSVSEEEIRTGTQRAIEVFMRAYGPDQATAITQ